MKYFAFAALLSVAGCCTSSDRWEADCCASQSSKARAQADSLRSYRAVAGLTDKAVLQLKVDSLEDVLRRQKWLRKHDLLGLGWYVVREKDGGYTVQHPKRGEGNRTTDPYMIGLWNQALNLRRELIAVGGPSEWEEER